MLSYHKGLKNPFCTFLGGEKRKNAKGNIGIYRIDYWHSSNPLDSFKSSDFLAKICNVDF